MSSGYRNLPSSSPECHHCYHRSPAHPCLKLDTTADAPLLHARSSMPHLLELLLGAPSLSFYFPVAPDTACSTMPGHHPLLCSMPSAFDPDAAVPDSTSRSPPPCLTPPKLPRPHGCASTLTLISPNCLHHPPPDRTCKNSDDPLDQQKGTPLLLSLDAVHVCGKMRDECI
jgi:hypothetical protein